MHHELYVPINSIYQKSRLNLLVYSTREKMCESPGKVPLKNNHSFKSSNLSLISVLHRTRRAVWLRPRQNLHELDGGLVPVGRGGDAIHVLHLGGIGEHDGSLSSAGEAGDLRAANAVVGGG